MRQMMFGASFAAQATNESEHLLAAAENSRIHGQAEDSQLASIRAELREELAVVLRAGQIMLENGANTARVEDTMRRIGRALGAYGLDIYATPTGIIASIHHREEHRTRILRIVDHGVDLNRVTAVLDVVAALERGELDRSNALEALNQVAVQPRVYNVFVTALGVGMAGASFAVLFGGGWWEFLAVFAIGFMVHQVRAFCNKRHVNRLLMTGLATGTGTTLSLIIGSLIPPVVAALRPYAPWLPAPEASLAVIIAAAGILLIPGILMVSSVSDLFRGDIISGMARGTMALLSIFAIGMGIWLVLLTSGVSIAVNTIPQTHVFLAFCAACTGAAGFGVAFGVPRKMLLFAGLVGGVAYGARQFSISQGVPLEAAVLIGGVAIGLCSEVWARLFRAPTSIFTIPGFIPLIPGVLALRAVLNFASQQYDNGISDMVRAALITCLIAAGLGIVAGMSNVGRSEAAPAQSKPLPATAKR